MSPASRFASVLLPSLLLLAQSRAAAQNLVTNPGFDTGLAGWGPTDPFSLTWDGTRDADGNPSSGSAQTHHGGGVLLTCFELLTQCINDITPGQAYEFGGKIFIPPQGPMPIPSQASVSVRWSLFPNCAFDSLTNPGIFVQGPLVSTMQSGAWIDSSGFTSPPPGYVSAQLQGVVCHTLAEGILLINYDDMIFRPASIAVIPTLGGPGLAAFAVLLATVAVLRRRRLRLGG